jgi:hypothetical protein
MVNAQADAMGEYPEPPRKAQWFMPEISAGHHPQATVSVLRTIAVGRKWGRSEGNRDTV